MKQKFTLEIDFPAIEKEGFKPLEDYQFSLALEHGLRHYFKKELLENAQISLVEQTCGTPDYSREKAIDLLKDACVHLSNSSTKYGISLSYNIEKHLKETYGIDTW